jgi:hypothetical protein
MSEWLKETGCKPVGLAYAGSNPAPPISRYAWQDPQFHDLIDATGGRGCEGERVPAVRLIVELHEGEPVSGWVAREDGTSEWFAGLLELLAAFDRLRAPPDSHDDDGAE